MTDIENKVLREQIAQVLYEVYESDSPLLDKWENLLERIETNRAIGVNDWDADIRDDFLRMADLLLVSGLVVPA